MMNQDINERNKFLIQHLDFLERISCRIVKKFKLDLSYIDDFKNIGIISLMEAYNKFDPKLHVNIDFRAFAYPYVYGRFMDEMRKSEGFFRSDYTKYKKIEKAVELLIIKNQRKPTIDEILEYTKMTIDDYHKSKEVNSLYFLEYNEYEMDDYLDDRQKYPTVKNFLLHEAEINDEASVLKFNSLKLILKEEKEKFLDKIIKDLTKEEKDLVSLRFENDVSVNEVLKILNITRSKYNTLYKSIISKVKSKIMKLKGEEC